MNVGGQELLVIHKRSLLCGRSLKCVRNSAPHCTKTYEPKWPLVIKDYDLVLEMNHGMKMPELCTSD